MAAKVTQKQIGAKQGKARQGKANQNKYHVYDNLVIIGII